MTVRFPLFVYGTLKDPQVRQWVFGHPIPLAKAVLQDFRILVAPDHYFFLESCPGHQVSGGILWLTQKELWRADQFEELPFYIREKVWVLDEEDEGKERGWWAFSYHRPGRKGIPLSREQENLLTTRPGPLLQKALEKFSSQMQNLDYPFGDLYVLIPCLVHRRPEGEGNRFLLGEKIGLVPEDRTGAGQGTFRQMISLYLSLSPDFPETGKGVILIPLPAFLISPLHLAYHLQEESFFLGPSDSLEEEEEKIPFAEFLDSQGLQKDGEPLFLAFLSSGSFPSAASVHLMTHVMEEFQDRYEERWALQRPLVEEKEHFLLNRHRHFGNSI